MSLKRVCSTTKSWLYIEKFAAGYMQKRMNVRQKKDLRGWKKDGRFSGRNYLGSRCRRGSSIRCIRSASNSSPAEDTAASCPMTTSSWVCQLSSRTMTSPCKQSQLHDIDALITMTRKLEHRSCFETNTVITSSGCYKKSIVWMTLKPQCFGLFL